MRTLATLALVTLSMISISATGRRSHAGEYNPVLDYGSEAPAWKKLPGIDGKTHSLADLKEKDFVVMFFTCNSCDYAREYEDRVIALGKKYAGKESDTAVVAINVNRIDEDALPAMKARAKERGFPFSYLYDESQEIAKQYGAIRTPEFFVLDKQRRIAYMGALDDSTDAKKVKVNHVEQALAALRNGEKPPVVETVAIGCRIRFERTRRKRRR